MATCTPLDELSAAEETPRLFRVLVVDDYPEMRKLLQVVLNQRNVDVETCANGHAALEKIRTWQPDLVMLDIMMPGMDGYAVLEAMRSQPETVELPVIMLSALGDTVDVVRGLQFGANDYLTKPFKEAELLARVDTQLKVKQLLDQRRADLKQLQELDSLKDRFLMMASHDLRGPLGTVLSAVQALEAQAAADMLDPEMVQQVAGAIQSSAMTMQSIIDDFLNLQAIKAGVLPLDLQPCSLNVLCAAAVEQFQYKADEKGITLQADLDPMLIDCVADANRLVQVLNNLVSNALKYSPQGSSVVVRTHALDEWLRVEVEDKGLGILEDEMPLLFREFSRLRNTPTNGEPSSGVGLSITRRLVEMHGGQVGAESTPGVGSIFWFELPRPAG